MFVKMLQSRIGTEDGFRMRMFEAEEVYDIPLSLASRFIREKFAVVCACSNIFREV